MMTFLKRIVDNIARAACVILDAVTDERRFDWKSFHRNGL